MLYTKSMIEYVFDIRKLVPAPIKASIKLTNPELFDFLTDFYWRIHDRPIKDKIEKLMILAGPSWISQLREQKTMVSLNRQKTYRGQAIVDADTIPASSPAPMKKATRIYRGQVLTN